jgi:multiple sugar transport system permease protein
VNGRTGMGPQARREERYFYLFIAPWVIGFLVFSLGPIIASLFFSFNLYDVVTPPRWAGSANYQRVFTDRLFWQALKVTSVYSVGSVALGIAASLIIALLLNRNIHGMAWFRTMFYLPSVISGVSVSLLWMWIFNPDFGILNYLLWAIFRVRGPGWIYSEEWVLPSLIVMSLWGIGGGIVIYLASLQGIPTELYEAAEIDGAGAWRKLANITLPLMTPVIFFQLIMGIIGSFQVFTQAYVMTDGGPHYASLFYVLYLYRNAFKYFKMGFASALAWILFLILLGLTVLVFRSAALWVYYEK